MEEQIGEEGLEAGGVDVRYRRTIVLQAKVTEQADVQGWFHVQPPSAMKGNQYKASVQPDQLQGSTMTPGSARRWVEL
jgi:hypothetical protein